MFVSQSLGVEYVNELLDWAIAMGIFIKEDVIHSVPHPLAINNVYVIYNIFVISVQPILAKKMVEPRLRGHHVPDNPP